MIENWALGAVSRLGRRSPSRVPALSEFVSSKIGNATKQDRSYRVYASQRRVKFTEMEYAIPRRNAAEAVTRILDAAERSDPPVGFPIEVRFVAADDAMLSPAHERDTCYIAVHQYEGVPWEGYFRSVEGVMEDYGGRPHWGKRHFQTAASWPSATRGGATSRRSGRASIPRAASATPTPTGCWARSRAG